MFASTRTTYTTNISIDICIFCDRIYVCKFGILTYREIFQILSFDVEKASYTITPYRMVKKRSSQGGTP